MPITTCGISSDCSTGNSVNDKFHTVPVVWHKKRTVFAAVRLHEEVIAMFNSAFVD